MGLPVNRHRCSVAKKFEPVCKLHAAASAEING